MILLLILLSQLTRHKPWKIKLYWRKRWHTSTRLAILRWVYFWYAASFIHPHLKRRAKMRKKRRAKMKKEEGFSVLTFFIYYSGCSCYPEKVGPRYPYVAQVSVISAYLTIISFKYYQMDPRGGRSLLFFQNQPHLCHYLLNLVWWELKCGWWL